MYDTHWHWIAKCLFKVHRMSNMTKEEIFPRQLRFFFTLEIFVSFTLQEMLWCK